MPKARVDVEELRRGGVVQLRGKDMFSLWVKSACGNVKSRQLRKLADVSERYGRGLLLFSTRQIPIIPWVHLQDVPMVKLELSQLEMELDRCGPRVRNTNICYEDNICPDAVLNSIALAEKVEQFFASSILHKIKIGVAGCARDCPVTRVLSDIGFVAAGREGVKGYDAYVGGRLGVNPFVGIRVAELLTEGAAVKLVENYFGTLEREGKPGERSADLITRLGIEYVRARLTQDLDKANVQVIPCKTRSPKKSTDAVIVRIRATCGEVTADQARKIAAIAEDYGLGLIHFAVHGAPEIPGVDRSNLTAVRDEARKGGLEVLEKGIDNIQTCFGAYCTESIVDTQSLLRQVESKAAAIGVDNLSIRIAAAGCPNSCGIAHLGDIGFHGVLEPEILDSCTSCGLCVQVCKRKAIKANGTAIIDESRCAHCGQCLDVCPVDAIREKRRGFAVLVGGREGPDTRLAVSIARFVSPEEALRLTEESLLIAKEKNASVAEVIDEVGLQRFKELVGVEQRRSTRC